MATNGNDTIIGTTGDDIILSGNGNDIVDGGNGNDTIDGGNGIDTLNGGSGNDRIDGGNGDDTLNGGSGSDSILGGNGDDTFIYIVAENLNSIDSYDGGNGKDVLKIVFDSASLLQLTQDHGYSSATSYIDALKNYFNGQRSGSVIDFSNFGLNLVITKIENMTLDLPIINPNHAPTALASNASTTEDTNVTLTAANFGFSDVDNGDSLQSIRFTQLPTDGKFTLDGQTITLNQQITIAQINDGLLKFEPNANVDVSLSASFQVSDGKDWSNAASLSISISAVNDAPTTEATVDGGHLDEDGSKTISVASLLALATDIDGDNLTLTVSNPSNGTVEIIDGNVIFTPAANHNGDASFEYTVSDGNGGTASGTVNLTVDAVNDAPTTEATVDGGHLDEDDSKTISVASLLALANDIDGDNLTLTVSNPSNGTVEIVDGDVIFTPAANHNGDASFEYTVSDGNGGTASGTVNLTVDAVNDAPTTEAIVDGGHLDEDGSKTISVASLLALANDIDGDNLTLTVSNPSNGTVEIVDGDVIFTPTANHNGDASFEYTVSDGNGGTASGTVNLTVDAVNDAPTTDATVDGGHLDEDGSKTISVASLLALADDIDGDNLTLTVSNPSNGTVEIVDGNVIFTPGENYHGDASFEYSVTDGDGATATGIVNLTVDSVNDVPTVSDSSITMTDEENHTFSVSDFIFNDIDTNDALQYVRFTNIPQQGLLLLNNNPVTSTDEIHISQLGNLVFEPNGFVGKLELGVQVSDGTDWSSNTGTITVNVTSLRVLIGDDNDNVIVGNNLANEIYGLGGNDTLIGKEGNDYLDGGSGIDTAVYGTPAAISYRFNENNELIVMSANINQEGVDTLTNIEVLAFTGTSINVRDLFTLTSHDYITFNSSHTLSNILTNNDDGIRSGGSNTDYIYGLGGIDTLNGNAGNDYLSGGDGNDTLNGGLGNDYLLGGNGDDRLIDSSGINLMDGGAGIDTAEFIIPSGGFSYHYHPNENEYVIDMSSGNTIYLRNVENLSLSGQIIHTYDLFAALAQHPEPGTPYNPFEDIRLSSIGSNGMGNFLGTSSDEHYYGGGGVDTLRGGNGQDYLSGGDGDDLVAGEGGNDFLMGGSGNDILQGDAGSIVGQDTAVYNVKLDSNNHFTYQLDNTGGVDRLIITHSVVGADTPDQGMDILTTIETITFINTSFAVNNLILDGLTHEFIPPIV